MDHYKIGDRTYRGDDADLQDALAACYDSSERPRCMCVPDGVEMYVSRFTQFVIKRMPDSGHKHAPACDSFELSSDQTGRSLHEGEAIYVGPDGRMQVRLGFPLTRYEGKAVMHSPAVGGTKDAVEGAKGSLTISALLHLLWHEAGFNKWAPKMHGKRYWGLIRHFIMQAATDIDAKGGCLADHLLMPEPFKKEKREKIAERLRAKLAKLDSPREGIHPLLVVVGELKELADGPLGGRAVIKHLPDLNLLVSNDLMKKLKRHFGHVIETVQTGAGLTLILACTVRLASPGKYAIEAATLMMVNAQWIPIENHYERIVAEALIAAQRSFFKVLRYGAPSTVAYANFALRDVGDGQFPMDIVIEGADKDGARAKEELIQKRGEVGWVWRTGQSLQMPALPAPSTASARAGQLARAATEAARNSEAAPETATAA